MFSKTIFQTARQFWHRHDLGINATLGISTVGGAYLGYNLTKDAELNSAPATVALKAGSTALGAMAAPLAVATCVGYPPMILVPLTLGVLYGLDASQTRAQQIATQKNDIMQNSQHSNER